MFLKIILQVKLNEEKKWLKPILDIGRLLPYLIIRAQIPSYWFDAIRLHGFDAT